MINREVLSNIFSCHSIDRVCYIELDDEFIFLIDKMTSSIPLNRWVHLENILKDVVKKEISILPYEYAKKHLKADTGKVTYL